MHWYQINVGICILGFNKNKVNTNDMYSTSIYKRLTTYVSKGHKLLCNIYS